MSKEIETLEQLFKEGSTFTYSNFCYPHEDYPGEFSGHSTPQWISWEKRVANAVNSTNNSNSPNIELVETALKITTKGNRIAAFSRAKELLLTALQQSIEALSEDKFNELIDNGTVQHADLNIGTGKIFIVHGHDSELKNDLERFLKEIGLVPIVLHRQPDGGATIIEKIEKHSDVGYTFILLTPDEIAYTNDQETVEDQLRAKEKRARPNVIFEFGYFVGKLGRQRVCCLHKGEVAVPSDLQGLVYKKVGSSIDQIGFSIIKELKAAGYHISI